MAGQPGYSRCLKQVGAVLKVALQARWRLREIEQQVEFRRLGVNFQRMHREAGKLQGLSWSILEHEQRLKERGTAQIPRWSQFLQELFIGQLLVTIGP